MQMPIAKEGIIYGVMPFLLGVFFLFVKFWITGGVFIAIAAFMFLFFRYPNRLVNDGPGLIYAPADGRIVYIGDENEKVFLKGVVNRVSIFMSIFNVHINYAPVSGRVDFVQYNSGRFNRADIVDAEETNENNFIGILSGSIKVGVRQVAGWIARRIVCDCKMGDNLSAGERFGLIKFGSRVDIFFPKDYDVCIKMGENVRAGRTALGRPRAFCIEGMGTFNV